MVEGSDFTLYFGPHRVGRVSKPFYSEFNWYGTLHSAEEMPARVRDFIAFCRDWHVRLDADQPHNADEFNDWQDIHERGEWWVAAPDGRTQRIRAPVFWPDGDICWRVAKDPEPFSE